MLFSANSGNMGKVKRGREKQHHQHLRKLFFFSILCIYVFSHSRYILLLSFCRNLPQKKNLSFIPWTSTFMAGTGCESQNTCRHLYTHPPSQKKKIPPSSAHIRATAVTFQANNQVSLLTCPSLICYLNLGSWTLFTCSFIDIKAALKLCWTLPRVV